MERESEEILDGCGSPDRPAPQEPTSAVPTARVRKALSFQTPAPDSRTPAHTPGLPSSSVASCETHGNEFRDTAASGGGQRHSDEHSAAKPCPASRTGTCVKVVKSRFMEPHSSKKPATARRASVGSATAKKSTDSRSSLPPQARRQSLAVGAKENVPANTSGKGAGGNGSSQAELRARLAAFRAGKGATEPAPAAAPATVNGVLPASTKPPLKGGQKPAKTAAQSNSPPEIEIRDVTNPTRQKTSFLRVQADNLGGAATIDGQGSDSFSEEQCDSGGSDRPTYSPAGSNATVVAAAREATTSTTQGKAYTRDEFAKELALSRWQELQWAHMRMRLERALAKQQDEAERTLSRAAAVVVALQRHVAQQRMDASRHKMTAWLGGVLSAELPELRAMHAVEAELRQGVCNTSAALHAALLQVPLVEGAVAGGSARQGTAAVKEQLRRCGGALEAQLGAIQQLLGNFSGKETAVAQGVASLGAVSKELKRTANGAAHLAGECARLLSEVEELSMQERSLQVHVLQLQSVVPPLDM